MSPYLIGWVAASLGLLPLVGAASAHGRGVRDASRWWVASAFAVSFVADVASFFLAPMDRWIVSIVFPVSQTAILGAVLLSRKGADFVLAALILAAIGAVFWHGVEGPDVLLPTVASASVVGIVVGRWDLGHLRTGLLIYFGLGLLAWYSYAMWPGWSSYAVYQAARATGIGFVVRALSSPVRSPCLDS